MGLVSTIRQMFRGLFPEHPSPPRSSKIIGKALTVAPQRGKVTMWGLSRPEASIEVAPDASPTPLAWREGLREFQSPPAPVYRSVRFWITIGMGLVILLGMYLTFTK